MKEEVIRIERYNPCHRKEWDEFVETAKNSSFLHRRAYMDYHSHRFADYSLMAYQEKAMCFIRIADSPMAVG